MSSLFYFSYFSLWIVTLITLLMIILLSKRIITIQKMKIIEDIFALNNELHNKTINMNKPYTKILLFLSMSSKNNEILVKNMQEKYPNSYIFLVFDGPEWKANSLQKKIDGQYTIWIDKGNSISNILGISKFPSYIMVDSLYRNLKERVIYI